MRDIIRKFTNKSFKAVFLLLPIRFRYRILLKLIEVIICDGSDIAVPAGIRRQMITSIEHVLENLFKSSKFNDEEEDRGLLECLLRMDNRAYQMISFHACKYDNGLHPKHRLIGYHGFFCRNIELDENVLDIGCGNGFLTSDIAKCTTGMVVGIDKSTANIEFAKANYRSANLQFILGDITTDIELPNCDVVVLSNVLEHLTERVQFLQRVRELAKPTKFLLRVPMYEREWLVPLKEELGLDFRLDRDHKIEYTQEQFMQEINAAGLTPAHLEFRWGEIWCRAVPDAGSAVKGQADR